MSIHAGIRAPLIGPKGDVRNDLRCGFEIVTARDIDRLGIDDVFDPAFAPGTLRQIYFLAVAHSRQLHLVQRKMILRRHGQVRSNHWPTFGAFGPQF